MAMHWLIERIDAPGPLFFSEKVGRDHAAPNAGYTIDRQLATRYATESLALDTVSTLGWFSQSVIVAAYEIPDTPDGATADVVPRAANEYVIAPANTWQVVN